MNLRKQISHLQKQYGNKVIQKLMPLKNKVNEILEDDNECEIWIMLYHYRDNNNHYNIKAGFNGNFDYEIEEYYWMNIITDAYHLPIPIIANILESNIAEIRTNHPIWDTFTITI